MTHLKTLAAVSFACVLAWGCDGHSHSRPLGVVHPTALLMGSGRVVTESRPVSGFSAISVSSAARLIVSQCDADSLSVAAEDNIMPLVRTEVVGDRLELGLAPGASISTTRGIVFEVCERMVTAIHADGATRLELNGIATERLSIDLSGASKVTGSGTTRQLQLDLQGGVRCELEDLASRSAVANVSGTSYARLRVADSLAATASGVSVVEYYGNPVVVANVSGLGVVRRLGS